MHVSKREVVIVVGLEDVPVGAVRYGAWEC
jgi:hypothetical protein